MHFDWRELLVTTRENRHGSWLAILIVIIATKSTIQVWLGGPISDTYALIVLTAVLTATYGLFRLLEVFNSPGFRTRYLVRGVNVVFMSLILLGQFFISDILGKALVLLALIAIEFNLVSLYMEYTGRSFHALKRLRDWIRNSSK